MKFVSASFLAMISLGVAFSAPAQANTCSFPCFDGPSKNSGASDYSGGGSSAVAVARRYLGGNPTGRSRLWCAHFMNLVERKVGRSGTGSGMARSYASYGRRVSDPRPGYIAVMRRRGGGHVGYVMSVSGNKVQIISGNHGRKLALAPIPARGWLPLSGHKKKRRPSQIQ
jgi:uncharacterized protein (TIGR02594 family)